MSDKESYYDQHIAPRLLEIAKDCEANGISLLAQVEWEPGEGGRTCTIAPNSSFGIRLTEVAAKSRGNVDSLIMALIRHADQYGHNSICLARLGCAHAPRTAPNQRVQPAATEPAEQAGRGPLGCDGLMDAGDQPERKYHV